MFCQQCTQHVFTQLIFSGGSQTHLRHIILHSGPVNAYVLCYHSLARSNYFSLDLQTMLWSTNFSFSIHCIVLCIEGFFFFYRLAEMFLRRNAALELSNKQQQISITIRSEVHEDDTQLYFKQFGYIFDNSFYHYHIYFLHSNNQYFTCIMTEKWTPKEKTFLLVVMLSHIRIISKLD